MTVLGVVLRTLATGLVLLCFLRLSLLGLEFSE